MTEQLNYSLISVLVELLKMPPRIDICSEYSLGSASGGRTTDTTAIRCDIRTTCRFTSTNARLL